MKRGRDTRPKKEEWYYDVQDTVSATEQTGMIPAPVQTESEAESYESIYPIAKQKPLK